MYATATNNFTIYTGIDTGLLIGLTANAYVI